MIPNIRVKQIDYHRNGICGAGFHVVLFRDLDEKRNMIATVFEERGHCAVYDTDMLAKGNITFGENSWRGDQYEERLRPAIKRWSKREWQNLLGNLEQQKEG